MGDALSVPFIVSWMFLPVFLCLYESFWKGFESDQRRLTLPVTNVCLFGLSDATVINSLWETIYLDDLPRRVNSSQYWKLESYLRSVRQTTI